jgi:hypothetical protein
VEPVYPIPHEASAALGNGDHDQDYAQRTGSQLDQRCDGRDGRSMPAFRSVVSVLVSFVGRSFSTSSRPALRAAACGGRPRAGSETTGTGTDLNPHIRE